MNIGGSGESIVQVGRIIDTRDITNCGRAAANTHLSCQCVCSAALLLGFLQV
jgi:hypothetical protein